MCGGCFFGIHVSTQFTKGMYTSAKLLVLFIVFVTMLGTLQAINSNRGREFIIGITENRVLIQDPIIRIFVTSSSDSRVDVNISTPRIQRFPASRLMLEPRQMVVKEYPYEMHMRGHYEEASKAIYIVASGDVTVQGASINDLSTDAFLALPTHVLGVDYFIMSYLYTSLSKHTQGPTQLGLVGVFDSTKVVITLPRADITIQSFTMKKKKKNGRYMVYMDRFMTVQLQSWDDLTGTRIQSDKPVSVFSGAVWTSVSMEFMGDHMVEHLPPTSSWGSEFFTVPVASRTAGDIFRILAGEEKTSLRIFDPDESAENMITSTIGIGQFFDFEAPSNQSLHVVTSKAVLLAQFSKSYEVDEVRRNDPFMTIVPPVEQFTNHYTFSTLTTLLLHIDDDFDHYLNVVILKVFIGGLKLDGRQLEARDMFINWTYLTQTNYSYATLTLESGVHNIWHDSHIASFSATLYGVKFQESYAHPLGQNVEVIDNACTKTAVIADDQFDNDCDYLSDEELLNNIDDDGDGYIDEDIATSVLVSKDAAMVMGNGSEWKEWKDARAGRNTTSIGRTNALPELMTPLDCQQLSKENVRLRSNCRPTAITKSVVLYINGTWINATISMDDDGKNNVYWNGQWIQVNNSLGEDTKLNSDPDSVSTATIGGFWLNGTRVSVNSTVDRNGQLIVTNSSNGQRGYLRNGKWVSLYEESVEAIIPASTNATTEFHNATSQISEPSTDNEAGFWWMGHWMDTSRGQNKSSQTITVRFWWNNAWTTVKITTNVNQTGFLLEGVWINIEPPRRYSEGKVGFLLNGEWVRLELTGGKDVAGDGNKETGGNEVAEDDGKITEENLLIRFLWNGDWISVNVSSGDQTGFWLDGHWIDLSNNTADGSTGFWYNGKWVALSSQPTHKQTDAPKVGFLNNTYVVVDENDGEFWWNGEWVEVNITGNDGEKDVHFWSNLNTTTAFGWIQTNETTFEGNSSGQWTEKNITAGVWLAKGLTETPPLESSETGVDNDDKSRIWLNGQWIIVNVSTSNNSTIVGSWLNGEWVEINKSNDSDDSGFWWNGKWIEIASSAVDESSDEKVKKENVKTVKNIRVLVNGTWVTVNVAFNTDKNSTGVYWNGKWAEVDTSDPNSNLTGLVLKELYNIAPYRGDIDAKTTDVTRIWWNGKWANISTSFDIDTNITRIWIDGHWVKLNSPGVGVGGVFSNADESGDADTNNKTKPTPNGNETADSGFWLNGEWVKLNGSSSGFFVNGSWVEMTATENGTLSFWWNGKWVETVRRPRSSSTKDASRASIVTNRPTQTGFKYDDSTTKRPAGSDDCAGQSADLEKTQTDKLRNDEFTFCLNGKLVTIAKEDINSRNESGFWWEGKWIDKYHVKKNEEAGRSKTTKPGNVVKPLGQTTRRVSNREPSSRADTTTGLTDVKNAKSAQKSSEGSFNNLMYIIPLGVFAAVMLLCVGYGCCVTYVCGREKRRSANSSASSVQPATKSTTLANSITSDLHGGLDPTITSSVSMKRPTFRAPDNSYQSATIGFTGHWAPRGGCRRSAAVTGRRSARQSRRTRILLADNELRSIKLH